MSSVSDPQYHAPQVAKNVALAGVGSLTLLDDALCKSEAAACNFLIPADGDQAQRYAKYAAARVPTAKLLVQTINQMAAFAS